MTTELQRDGSRGARTPILSQRHEDDGMICYVAAYYDREHDAFIRRTYLADDDDDATLAVRSFHEPREWQLREIKRQSDGETIWRLRGRVV